MNYLQIARETLSVESQALAQLSQRLDDEFSQVVDLILACEGRLVIGGIGKSGLIWQKKWWRLLLLQEHQVSSFTLQKPFMAI